MARIINQPFVGELRGSIGSSTFSRNRYGAFVRARVKPAQRDTQAQISSRSNLAAASQQYSGFDAVSQGAWNGFATSLFVPLHRVGAGNSTGLGAFVSLSTIVARATDAQYSALNVGIGSALLDPPPSVSTVPPPSSIQPNVQVDSGVASVTFQSVALTSNNTQEIKLKLSEPMAGTLSTLTDSNGVPIGIALYSSEPLRKIGQRAKNRYARMLGFIPVYTSDVPMSGSVVDLSVSVPTIPESEFTYPLTAGQVRAVTCVFIGPNGTAAEVGWDYITVS